MSAFSTPKLLSALSSVVAVSYLCRRVREVGGEEDGGGGPVVVVVEKCPSHIQTKCAHAKP